MVSRKIHKFIGLILILPMFGWVITGVVFLTKPGYEGAYEQLSLKTHPIEKEIKLSPNSNWEHIKIVRTSLGIHFLVKVNGVSKHINADDYREAAKPSNEDIRKLIDDAIQVNLGRYGSIDKIEDLTVTTSTGIEITLDWNTLKLKQYGQDRRIIEALYKIHYLQWTPWELPNRFLGVLGLLSLAILTIAGLIIYCCSSRKTRDGFMPSA